MVLVAMVYTSGYLDARMAENEFGTNKQFMQTTALQVDDIAWTIGRTQTVRYSSRYGAVNFQPDTLTYTVHVTTLDDNPLDFSYSTGIVLYNMPSTEYTLGNDYFERIFPSDQSDLYPDHGMPFVLSGSTAPISDVYVIEKMDSGSYTRISISPTVRMLKSLITSQTSNQTYVRFYMPLLISGTNKDHLSQSVTLIGKDITQYTRSNVTRVDITVSYPAASTGFDADYFRFYQQTMTLDSTSDPALPSNSRVEFYLGTVMVSLGLYA